MTSELKVDKITPASGTNTQIGEAGDTTNLSAGSVTLPTSIITGASEKTTLVDADKFLIADSEASNVFKHVQKSNLVSGTLGNFSATEFTTITFSSVADNSNSTQDFTSNLAVGFYLVEINTRGYATSDTNGIQVTANATSLHSGITMYALSPNSSGGGQGTRTTLASRREFWNVTSSTNSFRSSHGNISMWSSAHQTLPNLQGTIRALRIS